MIIDNLLSPNSYTATTENITIVARPLYLDGHSNILQRKFTFAYFIRIENHGAEAVQLMRRHWLIYSSDGEIDEVEGEGVIGVQPVIRPGHSYEYNSFSIIRTFEGTMEGTYQMKRMNGEVFDITIPRFVLRAASN